MAPHPRLLLPKGGEKAILQMISADTDMQRIHRRMLDACELMLDEQTVKRIKEGKRLLTVSRIALKRIFYLSYAFRMTGDKRYASRAEREMLAAANFTDWNPSHFLDVGEMVMALAIGYDWLYNDLSMQTRTTVREAIVEKGFEAAKNTKNAWFYTSSNNWNSVCNSGLLYGALALYDEIPDVSKDIVSKCINTNPTALSAYAPDGAYPEGFGYWGYGTSFQVLLSAALESALGTDSGLSQAPGFLQSARFIQFMTTPSGGCFAFSDSPVKVECNLIMFWFAEKCRDLSLLYFERQYIRSPEVRFAEDRLLPCLPIFASRLDLKGITAPREKYWFSRGATPVFIYRSGWEKPSDTWLGVKGGSPGTPHAHMDAGSFVYERDGVRWATDLGMQTYITLESKGVDLWNMSQHSQRWDVFRLGNMAHNTLTVNNERHLVKSFAPITQTFQSESKKGAEVNLSSVFAQSVDSLVRRVWLDGRDFLHVDDYIATGDTAAVVTWVMVTSADAAVTGPNTIVLVKDGKKMLLKATADSEVKMKIWSNEPPHDYDFKNPGTCRAGFELNVPARTETQIKVELIPIK
jgi:hypothetical protein